MLCTREGHNGGSRAGGLLHPGPGLEMGLEPKKGPAVFVATPSRAIGCDPSAGLGPPIEHVEGQPKSPQRVDANLYGASSCVESGGQKGGGGATKGTSKGTSEGTQKGHQIEHVRRRSLEETKTPAPPPSGRRGERGGVRHGDSTGGEGRSAGPGPQARAVPAGAGAGGGKGEG
jgi:hypothetical protein